MDCNPLSLDRPVRIKKIRLDHLLTERGLVESGNRAQRMIMAGLVYVNGQKADKPGHPVRSDVEIEVREPLRYVSRGALKLQAALETFPYPVKGAVCLDVGASTGGFTDLLLQEGAAKVYAVDVGHSQLHYRLREDERVINLEKTHIRELNAEHVPEPVSMLVIDTSFISLSTVLPLSWTFLADGGWCAALIKPQFEVGQKLLVKGVVKDEASRGDAVQRMTAMALLLPGADLLGVVESPIHGPKGNVEYLLVLRKGTEVQALLG
ncbi:MAG: TlyA family RNA methyltransferase [Mariprofundaceae bacterium]|nr:TlyA family RNA methyltransferase [Mariprofundaceae bacterium]